ncbi:HEAT repeat protein [Planctomycetes bacterium CA13]|uniref:HEAT repeat protein n=1 Tax=Novipirellula herctigrandis TaxID=2527986 RepID=A0A5C5ZB56_9BACT|nr:HEAT repeat protein [Planctomycetes bacterium CA13]
MWNSTLNKFLLLTAILLANASTLSFAQQDKLLAVLDSNATLQEKSATCRELARVATKDAVPTLAKMLGDEKLSHMARYALENIRDSSVDDALRNALGEVTGQPLLGVIGSLGARRDTESVVALAALLNEPGVNQAVNQAAARALGNIGTLKASEALEKALPEASDSNQRAICEGLLRCAEALQATEQSEAARSIYDRLRDLSNAPVQVRAAALRGAILSPDSDGIALLTEAIKGSDEALAAAAVRAAMESKNAGVTDAILAELSNASPKRQGLLIMALANRGEARLLPAVLQAMQSDDEQLRIVAFRVLKRVGDESCVPALLNAAVEGNAEISQAAIESLEILQGNSVDDQVAGRLSEAQGKMRIVLIDLAGRRRTAAAIPALWKAVDDDDSSVRTAALASLGATIDTANLPKLIARLGPVKDDKEAAALDNALRDVCLRSVDREAAAAQLATALRTADGDVKGRILDTLNVVGGASSLKAVTAAARSNDTQLRNEGFRVLGQWKSVDAAPILLDLHNSTDDGRLKIRSIRAYIRIARQFDMPAEQRTEMCRTALKTATRDTDKQLVLEVLLRYPSEEMQAIALEASKVPALKDQAMLVVLAMASKDINRADLGKALAQAGQKPVKLEIVEAVYGAGTKTKDVTATLSKYAKNYRIIFLPSTSYNESFGGDPADGIVKQLKIKYRIDGKQGEVSLAENATIVLPVPK